MCYHDNSVLFIQYYMYHYRKEFSVEDTQNYDKITFYKKLTREYMF